MYEPYARKNDGKECKESVKAKVCPLLGATSGHLIYPGPHYFWLFGLLKDETTKTGADQLIGCQDKGRQRKAND